MSFIDFNSHFAEAVQQQECDIKFGYLIFSGPSTKTVLCTIVILGLTLAIELVAHAWKKEDCCYEKDADGNIVREAVAAPTAPAAGAQAENQAANPSTGDAQTPGPGMSSVGDSQSGKKKKKADHVHKPSPVRRANRLAAATMLLIPITIAFAVRMKELEFTLPRKCQSMHIAPRQWWAVVVFNIIPFSFACLAWLRTLVDCILVRWDKTLSMTVWPPVLPLALVAVIVTTIGILLRDLVFVIMGRPDLMTVNGNKSGERDIEMQGRSGAANEEGRGLLESENALLDGLLDDDDDATVYSPRSSTEKHEVSPV